MVILLRRFSLVDYYHSHFTPLALVVCLICLFCLPSQTVMLEAVGEDSMYWRSCLKEEVKWWFDCSAIMASTEGNREGDLCTVCPSSGTLRSGQSICLDVCVRPNALRKGEKLEEVGFSHTLKLK